MQKIKLVVLDIDGTLLLPYDTTISQENRAAIKEAQQAGVMVTLATGRVYSTVRRWAEMLEITCPVIGCNGADIRIAHRTVECSPADDRAVRGFVKRACEIGADTFLFCGDEIWCSKDDYNRELFSKWSCGNPGELPVIMRDSFNEIFPEVQGKVMKALAWTQNDRQHTALVGSMSEFSGIADVVVGEALNVEVTNKGVSKASALKKVAGLCHVELDEIMAVGDSGNDVELLRAVGLGVAVENAMPEAKNAADHVVAACWENGVAQAIRQFAV